LKTILVDFDGVLHSYTSGWKGAEVASDPPTPGAIEWLQKMLREKDLILCVYSSRSNQTGGIRTIKDWLYKHGLSPADIGRLEFPISKPAAWLTIDDRCICFSGAFPTAEEIHKFKPWNKI